MPALKIARLPQRLQGTKDTKLLHCLVPLASLCLGGEPFSPAGAVAPHPAWETERKLQEEICANL